MDEVIEKMTAYGDRVQFDLPGKGQRPNYQVISASGRKMGFDGKSLLMRLNENGEISDNLSSIFTLEQIKSAKLHIGVKQAKPRARRTTPIDGTVSSRSSASRSVAPAVQAVDTTDAEKYQYFKNNRDHLPEGIQKHSAAIGDLMRSGMSAEDAFGAIIKQHY
jgi:hypothetical protein